MTRGLAPSRALPRGRTWASSGAGPAYRGGRRIVTEALTVDRPEGAGPIQADPTRDLLKLFVVERYTGTAGRAGALVRGFGLQAGAIATSVAHDAHNVIAVGADDGSLARAANCLREHGGGRTSPAATLPARAPGAAAQRAAPGPWSALPQGQGLDRVSNTWAYRVHATWPS